MSHNHHPKSLAQNSPPTLEPAGPMEAGSLVAVYETAHETENALLSLENDGIDLSQVSVVGPCSDSTFETEISGESGEMVRPRRAASVWIRIQSLLVGSQFFNLPGIGPVLTAGPMVTWMTSALEGPPIAGNLTALCTALFNIGIPGNHGREYESDLKSGRLLAIIHGTQQKIGAAKQAIARTAHRSVRSHSLKRN